MSIGRKIMIFLRYGSVVGDPLGQETLECFIRMEEKHSIRDIHLDRTKIETIKWLRRKTYWGLRQSKQFVDRLLVDVGILDKDYFRDSILRTQ